MTKERVYTVPEVDQFLGITPQAVRRRIVEGRREASKVRVKGAAREYHNSAETIRDHYDMSDAEVIRCTRDMVHYRVGFMDWNLGLPFPNNQSEHSTYDNAVTEAKRVLAMLPQFWDGNMAVVQWLPVEVPKEPGNAIVYPDSFDLVNHGMNLELRGVAITNGAEQRQ